MLNLGEHTLESYAHILNADKSILKLNSAIEKFGYNFLWIDATEFETNYSELFNVPKDDSRPHTIIVGRESKGLSHELHNAIIHTQTLHPLFLNMEYPGIILLRKLKDFKISDPDDFLTEKGEFENFYPFVQDLLLQLRLYKEGELKVSQFFHISATTRQISLRKREVEIGSYGDYILNDQEAEELSKSLVGKYEANSLTELATKNFSIVYNLPDLRARFILLMSCLESLFNLGKDQIAHTIARHLSIIISNNQEQFQENYSKIKKLYNMRNAIVHGGQHKGDLVESYLDLSNMVRTAISYCNTPDLTKEKLFEELNCSGY